MFVSGNWKKENQRNEKRGTCTHGIIEITYCSGWFRVHNKLGLVLLMFQIKFNWLHFFRIIVKMFIAICSCSFFSDDVCVFVGVGPISV